MQGVTGKSVFAGNMKKQSREYVILFFVVCLMALTAFWIRGIFPFGVRTIEGDDGYNQQVPLYYFLWDVYHGVKRADFDWAVGIGSPMFGVMLHFGLLSPLNLAFAFVSHESVLQLCSYLAILRFVLCAFSFCYMLRKVFPEKTNSAAVILLSAMYGINSFTMHYLYFFQWMDAAILLPFIVASLWILLREGKARLRYTLGLALFLVINVQMDMAMLFFLILFSGIVIADLRWEDPEKSREATVRLGIYTLVAALVAAAFLLPAIRQVSGAWRMNTSWIFKIKEMFRSNADPDHDYDTEKWIIYGSGFFYGGMAAILFVLRRIRKKKIDRFAVLLAILAVLLFLQFPVESIHYFWQGGTYLCFPLRAGFQLLFVLLFLIARLLQVREKERKYYVMVPVMIVVCALLGVISGKRLGRTDNNDGVLETELCLYEEYGETPYTERFRSRFEGNQLCYNFPLIAGVASIENYIHIVPKAVLDDVRELGYFRGGTVITGKGGTHFADALLGVRYVISDEDEEAAFYEDIGSCGEYRVYRYNCEGSFGRMIYDEAFAEQCWDNERPFLEYQNGISKALCGKELYTIKEIGAGETIRLELPEDAMLYADNITADEIELTINGAPVVAGQERVEYLGRYDGTVEISATAPVCVGYCTQQELEQAVYSQTVTGAVFDKEHFECDAEAEAAGMLFLPIHYSEGMYGTVDGVAAEIKPVLTGYVGIQIPEAGIHRISLRYRTPGIGPGLVIALCGIVFLALDLKLGLTERLAGSKLRYVAVWCFRLLFAGLLFGAYVCNLIFAILPPECWYFLVKPKY